MSGKMYYIGASFLVLFTVLIAGCTGNTGTATNTGDSAVTTGSENANNNNTVGAFAGNSTFVPPGADNGTRMSPPDGFGNGTRMSPPEKPINGTEVS